MSDREPRADRIARLAGDFVRMFARDPERKRLGLWRIYADQHCLHGRDRQDVANRVAWLLNGEGR